MNPKQFDLMPNLVHRHQVRHQVNQDTSSFVPLKLCADVGLVMRWRGGRGAEVWGFSCNFAGMKVNLPV